MSQFYDQASLVMVPSGYKAGKVYSQKPLSTDGELTFTRNSNATRVNADGLLEKVRTNLATYSNDFSNADWAKLGQGLGITPVVTPNYTTDPFGSNNGWRLQCDLNGGTTNSDRSWLQQTIAGTTVPTTVSVYVKLNSAGTATFSVNNGSTDSVTITSTDWVRVSSVRTSAATSYLFRIGLIGGVGQSGSIDISIAFAQLEVGDIMTDYIATTSAAVSVGPTANVPRLNYSNGCPSLLLEPQRTNLALWSEQMDNAAWNKQATTVTANAGISPDGYQNADKLIPTAAFAFHSLYQNVTNATSFTVSVFAKASGYNFLRMFDQSSGAMTSAIFDLANGTTTGGKIENYGNGWYRCTAYGVNPSAQTAIPSYTPSPDGIEVVFNGDGTSGVLLWGFQFESLASYATSYIGPTLGASVTRLADAAYKTGISSLIGQTEGTIFLEFDATELAGQNMNLINFDNSLSASALIRKTADGRITGQVIAGGSSVFAINSIAVTGVTKAAFAYKSGDSVLYVNGTAYSNNSTFTFGAALSELRITASDAYFNFPHKFSTNQALLFKTRLTNAQLAELTTL